MVCQTDLVNKKSQNLIVVEPEDSLEEGVRVGVALVDQG